MFKQDLRSICLELGSVSFGKFVAEIHEIQQRFRRVVRGERWVWSFLRFFPSMSRVDIDPTARFAPFRFHVICVFVYGHVRND